MNKPRIYWVDPLPHNGRYASATKRHTAWSQEPHVLTHHYVKVIEKSDFDRVNEQLRQTLVELSNRMTIDELAAFTAKINADNVQDSAAVSK